MTIENEGGDAQLSDNELSAADRKTMRLALLDMVRLYLDRDINAGDVAALLGFLWSVRDDQMARNYLKDFKDKNDPLCQPGFSRKLFSN